MSTKQLIDFMKWILRKLLCYWDTFFGIERVMPHWLGGASSSDLFKELGASAEEAAKMERGINAVIIREQMKQDN